MPALKILITGGSGLLGHYLNSELAGENSILTVYHNNIGSCGPYNSVKADITDGKKVEELFSSFRPDITVHTASVSRPEIAAKMTSEEVYRHNVTATMIIAQLCGKYASRLIYTSTDLVYDGNYGSMLKEDAPLNPVSLYAETKLQGELAIQEVLGNYIILRTSLLYGLGMAHTSSQFQNMYNSFLKGDKVKLFFDQFRTPLSLKNAAEIISHLCKSNISGEIINFGGRERISRMQLGEYLCREAGFNTGLIIKTSMYDIQDLPKVKDVSMDTSKLRQTGARQMGVIESIREILGL